MKYIIAGLCLLFATQVKAEEYYYNDKGLIEKDIYADGKIRIHTYDEDGKRIYTQKYNSDGIKIGGYEVIDTLDENGLLIERQNVCPSCTRYIYEYDDKGNLITQTAYKQDQVSQITYQYDQKGNPISYIEDGKKYTYKLDKYGNPIELYSVSGKLVNTYNWSENYIKSLQKRIYTVKEATNAAGKKNSVMIRYK